MLNEEEIENEFSRFVMDNEHAVEGVDWEDWAEILKDENISDQISPVTPYTILMSVTNIINYFKWNDFFSIVRL